jgi:prevent-host-death family protein
MNITEIGAFEAKTRLSELLDRVARGQVYRITKRGRPVAELRPVVLGQGRPQFGTDKGRVAIGADFDAPVPGMAEYLK